MTEDNSTQSHTGILQAEKQSPSLRSERISNLRKSLIIEQGGDSSFKVITSIANTMIGSSIIVYPIVFIKDGMLGSLIVLLVIGAALYFTCRLLVLHNKHDELDFGQTIKRILGPKWARFNSIINITLLYVVSIAYFMLICSNFFSITSAIITQIVEGYVPPEGQSLVFSKYSPQYASLICILFTAPLICKRDIETLMIFFKITIYFVFAYGIFILFAFIKVLAQGELNFTDQYRLFDPDFSTVAGAFALSLLLHPVGAPILKKNINQANNMRDLLLGYGLTALIYVYVGFLGGLTCAPHVSDIYENQKKYSIIFDCFTKGQETVDNVFFVFGKIVQFGIFIQNLSVMPILSFLTRKEFIDLFQIQQTKNKAFYGYNASIIFLCVILTFFNVDVTIVMSLNGAIVGYFMAYVIPITAHLTCYHKKLTNKQIKDRSQLLLSVETDDQTKYQIFKCNQHPKRSYKTHLIIYGGLLLMGFAVACFKIYSLTET